MIIVSVTTILVSTTVYLNNIFTIVTITISTTTGLFVYQR